MRKRFALEAGAAEPFVTAELDWLADEVINDFISLGWPLTASNNSSRRGRADQLELVGDSQVVPDPRYSTLIRFSDAIGGTIVLSHRGNRFEHIGTVSPRLWDTSLEGLAAPQPTLGALRCVLDWYGRPFDALRLGHHRMPLRWGILGFSGRALAESLASFKSIRPEMFEASLGRYGIRIKEEADNDGVRNPRLLIETPQGSLIGRDAERLITLSPELSAALSRAGRIRDVQLAQLQCVLRAYVGPILASNPQGEAEEAPALSARVQAGMIYLGLRLGLRGCTKVLRAAGALPVKEGNESDWFLSISTSLEQLQRREAQQILRIYSASQLDPGESNAELKAETEPKSCDPASGQSGEGSPREPGAGSDDSNGVSSGGAPISPCSGG